MLATNHDNTELETLSDQKGKRCILPEAECRNTNNKEELGTWIKPNGGWVKLNWDASYKEDEN
jgi:hypothetical protein